MCSVVTYHKLPYLHMSHLRVGGSAVGSCVFQSAANGTSEGFGSACANPNPPEILLQCVLQRPALEGSNKQLVRFASGS